MNPQDGGGPHGATSQSGKKTQPSEKTPTSPEHKITRAYLEELMAGMAATLKTSFQTELRAAVSDIRREISGLTEKTTSLENRLSESLQRQGEAEEEISCLGEEISLLKEGMEEQDNRDRRQNIRVRGVPESVTQEQIRPYLLELFNLVCGELEEKELEMDRAHPEEAGTNVAGAEEATKLAGEAARNCAAAAGLKVAEEAARNFSSWRHAVHRLLPPLPAADADNVNGTPTPASEEKITPMGESWDSCPNPVAPEGHVSPETEQVSSPGSVSSTHLEEHDEEDYDDDDDDATAIHTQIEASDHEDVPIETVLPANRPANMTYDAIVASEGKIVEAENRRHSDFMTVLERMIALQEETVSQLAHLHRVFIEVPKQLQKINTSFEALVVQQTQANYWRMTNVPQFNTSQPGSVHAGQFSPHSSDIHSPGPNVTGQVAEIAVQVPDDILPLPSVQNQQLTPTKEPTKTKYKQLLLTSFWSKTTKDTHETDQPSLVQCLPTCSQSLPKSPVGESLPKSPVGESLPKSPVGESLPKSPVGESLATSPVGESLATSPVGEQSLPKSPVDWLDLGHLHL
ncbi:uncharacterized protein LOC142488111 [Ascaphus truei]|uniref:uncharacterized protein LOC142488111 n=1 Tax=Ascaphus truei TaxID=8439 RepID=UPI003F59E7BC